MYLFQVLYNTETEEQKQNLIQTIKNGSVVIWQHVNLYGEYDFSDETLGDSIKFEFPKLKELKVG